MKMLGTVFLCLTAVPAMLGGDTPEQAEIRTLIEKAYINGAFNEQNVADLEAGFHKDFAFFSAQGAELRRYQIGDCVADIKKHKAGADYDPDAAKIDHNISHIDVTGGVAAARVDLSKNGKLVYTEYLSFIKFADGWKIAAKVYHRHEE